MSKVKGFIKKYVPIFSLVCLGIFIISFILITVADFSPAFAEALSGSVGYVLRRTLAALTDILPFSLAELALMLLPLAVTLLIVYAVKVEVSKEKAIRFLAIVLACAALVYSAYVFTLGVGYKTPSLDEYLGLEECDITAERLGKTMLYLESCAEELLDEIEYGESGSSVYEADIGYISAEICAAYDRLIADIDTLPIKNYSTDAKPVIMSRGMSDLEILGIYTFFTGESNVNTHYPDYTLPFTVAHEFAHQRGISRENEANFIAFLVCIRADDPYIKYSGYVTMYEYLASSLAKTDRDSLKAVYSMTDDRIMGELRAYTEFYYANKNETMANISNAANDWYLKTQGTEGVISYGLVTKLCIYYYADIVS